MRWSRIPLRAPAILFAVAAGLLLDPLTDAYRVSLLTTLSILTLVSGVVALRRTAAH
jgi:predicted Kef-type K+ transport protein